MLITCDGCNSKIRVLDSAAGKRVKCPKCATVVKVSEAEKPPESDEPDSTAISSVPLPPTSEPAPQEPADPEAFSATPPSKGSNSAAADRDDDEDEDDAPDIKKKRDRLDDDDDDDLNVRRRRQPINGLATTSMIMGIISLSVVALSCCCCGLYGPIVGGPIGGICAVLAIIFGFMGKSPGSEGYAWAGIICGGSTIILVLLWFLLGLFGIGMALLIEGMQQNQRGR